MNWRIVWLCVFAACFYGVVHDQVTVRISPEYFIVGHPPYFPTSNPTLLALCWGVAGTWWVGAAFGFVLSLLLNHADGPRLIDRALTTRFVRLFIATAVAAVIAGFVGYKLSQRGIVSLPGTSELSDRHRFAAAWFAHVASYIVGVTGSVVVVLRIWREQGSRRVLAFYPATTAGAIRVVCLAITVLALIYWRAGGG